MDQLIQALLVIVPIIAFIIGFIIVWYRQEVKGINQIVEAIVTSFLDERGFQLKDIESRVDLPEPVISNALNQLSEAGVLTRKGSWYKLNDPLVFLSEKDMIRASRLTKDDNILYAAYQNPFLSNLEALLVYMFFVISIIFSTVCFFVPAAKEWFVSVIVSISLVPPASITDLDIGAFLLFIILI